MLCNFILLFPHDILLLLVMLLLGYIGLRFCSHLLLRTAGGGYSPVNERCCLDAGNRWQISGRFGQGAAQLLAQCTVHIACL